MSQQGGQIKETIKVSKALVKTSGNIVNDLAKGLANTIGGVTNGLEIVAGSIGSTLNELSKNLQITSTKVVSRVGNLGLKAAKELGNVIKVVPILGQPVAYVVKGTGRGVYYVVTTVGHVVGKGLRSTGRVSREATDLVVFTIASTSTATEKTIEEAGKVVKKVSHSLTGNKNKNKKTVKHGRKSHGKTRKNH